jgi:hypothetical protein
LTLGVPAPTEANCACGVTLTGERRANCRGPTDRRGAGFTVTPTGGLAGSACPTTAPGATGCATGPASKAARQK